MGYKGVFFTDFFLNVSYNIYQSWDDDVATVAQAYADNCFFGHDSNYKRVIPGKLIFEPPRRKINVVVSDQVRHKPSCTSTEDG